MFVCCIYVVYGMLLFGPWKGECVRRFVLFDDDLILVYFKIDRALFGVTYQTPQRHIATTHINIKQT